jgi:hypothetical protein
MTKNATQWVAPDGSSTVTTANSGVARLLENGTARLEEDGTPRILEDAVITPKEATAWDNL